VRKTQIDNVEIHLANPVELNVEWIGQEEPLTQLLACWLTLGPTDQALCPRLVGHPGLGKTTLAMAAARKRGQEVFVLQCTADTRPEDLVITPVLGEKGNIKYQASALVTAMITGGAVILDEGNRMSEKSWASLAPLLDDRRSVDSLVAGISIKAHKDFRCVVTMNEDDSTFEIPDYIMSRPPSPPG
jgi:MoxR-like ATPase